MPLMLSWAFKGDGWALVMVMAQYRAGLLTTLIMIDKAPFSLPNTSNAICDSLAV